MQHIIDINDRAAEFWLNVGAENWFIKSDKLDNDIKRKFGDDIDFLTKIDLVQMFGDEKNAQKMVGIIICLDQFRRNIYRNDARAFAQDDKALALAKHIHNHGLLETIVEPLQMFAKMPYMHSEVMADQEMALEMFEHSEFAVIHYDIIKQFGRFPHRNACLERKNSDTEIAFLTNGGFAG